jgi:ribosomal protein L11 methyltransferase
MKSKSVWRIAATVRAEAEEAVLDLFTRVFGRHGVEVVAAPGDGRAPSEPSSYVDLETRLATVSVYFEERRGLSPIERIELAAGFKGIRECGLEIGRPKLSVGKLPRQDWAESWKRHFQPIEIGSALLIKPSWSKRRPRKGQGKVILDPGLSFGTGQHPTTEFCLQELVNRRNPAKKQSLLDIGTGSGILAIAAARLGYSPVDAFDFDSEAIRVASANAKRNRVLDKIHFFQQDVSKLPRTGAKYSAICANLISNLLITARARILARLTPDGVVIVAGILKTEFHGVQQAYRQAGLRLVASRVENEWRSGSFAPK